MGRPDAPDGKQVGDGEKVGGSHLVEHLVIEVVIVISNVGPLAQKRFNDAKQAGPIFGKELSERGTGAIVERIRTRLHVLEARFAHKVGEFLCQPITFWSEDMPRAVEGLDGEVPKVCEGRTVGLNTDLEFGDPDHSARSSDAQALLQEAGPFPGAQPRHAKALIDEIKVRVWKIKRM